MTKVVKNTFPTMLALAREQSDLSRVQLAGMLGDLFLNPDVTLSLREEEMANELIDQLMTSSSPQIRTQLVEKFVDVSRMPRRIAANLASDKIENAYPVLVASQTLTDGDLVHVIESKGRDHALAVAARDKISEAVADALVTTGDVRVMQAVAENLGAHLSANAVEVVCDAARYAVELRDPIFHRKEMTMESALKLYWWVEQDLRRYSMKRFGITSGQIDHALATTITTFLNDHVHQKANDEVMAQVAEWMHMHQAITPQILPQVLRMGHFRLFNMLLANMAKLSLALVDTIITETGGRGLAAICRAIDIDKAGFVSLFLLSRANRPGEHLVHPKELSHALLTFDRMTPAIAKDLLHSWTINPEYFSRHADESMQEERAYYS